MTKEVLMERLCALVPKPRKHLVTYHGVLAPATGLRSQVVPKRVEKEREGERCNHGTAGGAAAVPAPVAVRRRGGGAIVVAFGIEQERRAELGHGRPLAGRFAPGACRRGDRLAGEALGKDLAVAASCLGRSVLAEVDPATLAFGVADEHHVPAAGPVVDWRGDAQLLGLHFCPPAVFLQQLRAVECVRLGEAKCPIAWEDERKNGAGDRDRTDDIQLGKLTFYR